MLAKVMRVLKLLYAHQVLMGENCTVGELSRGTKIPYTTVKRMLEKAEKSQLVEGLVFPYKSTGKRVYSLTPAGLNWVECSKELWQ